MDGFAAYRYFMAVRLHFTTEKYDVFEKNGRVSGTRATFEKRNDRALFERLARKFDTDQELIQFLVANFAYGNKNVVYSYESDEYYREWIKRKESRTQMFQNDLRTIVNKIDFDGLKAENLFSIESGYPDLLRLYVGGVITLDTMVIIQDFEDYLSQWEPLVMLWNDHFLTIRKAKRFVKYDQNKLKSIYSTFKEELLETHHG